MHCTPTKIIPCVLNARWRFHVGANEFKHVGLLPIEYRVEQLMLGHMFNIINGNAPTYLISGISMNKHTNQGNCHVLFRELKVARLTLFLYQGVCH